MTLGNGGGLIPKHHTIEMYFNGDAADIELMRTLLIILGSKFYFQYSLKFKK